MATTTDRTPTPGGAHRVEAGGRAGKGRGGGTDRAKAERNLAWKLCAPAVIAMLLVTGYPILYAIYLSLQRYDLRFPDERSFVFLDNYVTALSSGVFWGSVLHTAIITIVSVVIELVIGLALALVMHRAIFGRRTIRTSVLIPYGIITVVAAFAFQFAVSPGTGFLPFGDYDPLGSTIPSYVVIIITEVWKTTPFMSLLLLAGLAAVPEVLQEAAKVDGATFWQRLFKVTLPNMKSAILVALLFRTLDAFRIFDTIFIQTEGANNTDSISQLGYNTLINRVNLGLGSAISVLLFIFVILIAFIFVKGFRTDLGQVRGDR